jgi:TolB protein
MNAVGTDPRPVTLTIGWEGDPSWWPDGSRLLFACDREDSPGNMMDICEINANGTGERRVLFHRMHDSHPVVSPDGHRIAFTATSDGNAEIYLMNADGSGLVRLTRNPADDVSPEWSPDGSKLAFLSNRGGKFAIYEIEMP